MERKFSFFKERVDLWSSEMGQFKLIAAYRMAMALAAVGGVYVGSLAWLGNQWGQPEQAAGIASAPKNPELAPTQVISGRLVTTRKEPTKEPAQPSKTETPVPLDNPDNYIRQLGEASVCEVGDPNDLLTVNPLFAEQFEIGGNKFRLTRLGVAPIAKAVEIFARNGIQAPDFSSGPLEMAYTRKLQGGGDLTVGFTPIQMVDGPTNAAEGRFSIATTQFAALTLSRENQDGSLQRPKPEVVACACNNREKKGQVAPAPTATETATVTATAAPTATSSAAAFLKVIKTTNEGANGAFAPRPNFQFHIQSVNNPDPNCQIDVWPSTDNNGEVNFRVTNQCFSSTGTAQMEVDEDPNQFGFNFRPLDPVFQFTTLVPGMTAEMKFRNVLPSQGGGPAPTPVPTQTPTPGAGETPTFTPTPTATPQPTPGETATSTPTSTPTPENTPTATATASPTPTIRPTLTPQPTPEGKATPTATATTAPAFTPTSTPTIRPTLTPQPTPEGKATPTATATPTKDPPRPSATPSR